MDKTYAPSEKDIERKWYIVDGTGVSVGRLASQVAQVLRGKHKTSFAYNQDCGDFVIITNAEKVVLTGGKGQELLYWHTGWPNGLRSMTREQMKEKDPVLYLQKTVKGMLPKSKLGKQMSVKLKVYVGNEHPHQAQQPTQLDLMKK